MTAPVEEPGNPAEEEYAAAEEAAAIGGPDPYPGTKPEQRSLAEAGGGEAEGFELAEEDLRRNAEHDDGHGHPIEDRFSPEAEADEATVEYGEPDEFGEHEDDSGSQGPDQER